MEQERRRLSLEGRIDSGNASAVEEKLLSQVDAFCPEIPVIDASSLEYISSAGLRILMKIRKRCSEKLEIVGVSPDVYEIFDTTGFTELFTVRRRIREISLDGCEEIGRGFYGTVYRLDPDTIVKIYDSPDAIPMIENEKRMARLAFLKGIPTAISFDIVRCGNRYGSVFELLKSETFNDRIIEHPDRADEIIREYVDFLKTVHETVMDPGTIPSAREQFLGYVEKVSGYLPGDTAQKCRALLEALPPDLHVVHGDFQMKNVMLSDGEPILIDMDTLSTGQPIFDLAALYVTYQAFEEDEPGNSMSFLGIDNEMADHIWRRIPEYYFGSTDESRLEKITDRIRILAGLRFLYLLAVTDLKNGTLGELRIRHTAEHLAELSGRVEDLMLPV